LRNLLFELTLNNLIKRDNINEYTTKLLNSLKNLLKILLRKQNYIRESNLNKQQNAQR